MTGQIIGLSIGMSIGLGMIAGASVLTKQGKLKTGQKVLFFGIGIAIFLAAMVSLITHFKP